MTTSEIQNKYIQAIIKEKSSVYIFLKNGIKLSGKIMGETDEVIFLSSPALQMVYKSSISTVVFNSPA